MRLLPENLDIFKTSDGSPTLMWRRPDGYAEKMHHSGGALEESIYIYHQALCLALQESPQLPPRVLSIGLGLGYNEWLCLGEFARLGLSDWHLWSFEAHPQIKTEFVDWLISGKVDSALAHLFMEVRDRVSQRLALDANQLHAQAQGAFHEGRLQMRCAFPEDCKNIHDVNVVLYDAYSKKMDPHLWDEKHLLDAFSPLLGSHCVLATYAATGSLNRTLKQLNFNLIPKTGFLGKRESTLARREQEHS